MTFSCEEYYTISDDELNYKERFTLNISFSTVQYKGSPIWMVLKTQFLIIFLFPLASVELTKANI